MKTVTVSVTKIPPVYLFLIRWAVKIVGANIVVCGKRKRKEATG